MLSAPDLLPRGSHREPPSAKALLPYLVKLEFSLPPYGYMFAFFYLPSHVFGFTLLENDERSFRPSGQVQLCPPNPGPESNALLQEQQYHPAVDAECADDMFLEVPKGGSQTDALREDWLWKAAQHQYSPCHSFSKID